MARILVVDDEAAVRRTVVRMLEAGGHDAVAAADAATGLQLWRAMATTIERDPGAFKGMSEENLRTVFLVALNSHYKGRASGETFNVSGKTDIIIREADKTLFIAECKFWDGPASLTMAIDQLLSYTSWRDTKTAILLFNRRKGFSSVPSKVPGTVAAHPNFRADLGRRSETEFRYRFVQNGDDGRDLLLALMAFNVPA